MMGVMHLIIHIQSRQSNLSNMCSRSLVAIADHTYLRAKIRQNSRRLMDHERRAIFAGTRHPQDGRSESRRIAFRVSGRFRVDEGHELADAVFLFVADVAVGYTGGFEREADELAPAGHAGPVEKLVLRRCALFLGGWGGHCETTDTGFLDFMRGTFDRMKFGNEVGVRMEHR